VKRDFWHFRHGLQLRRETGELGTQLVMHAGLCLVREYRGACPYTPGGSTLAR
jgi:hypothetical protein